MELRLLAALPTLVVFMWVMWGVINDLAVMLADPPDPPRKWWAPAPWLRRERVVTAAVLYAGAQLWFWTVIGLA